jgi:hypothetical protein
MRDGQPLVTDNGQYILDVHGLKLTEPLALEALISHASQARSAWQLGEAASRTDQNQRLPSAGESQED